MIILARNWFIVKYTVKIAPGWTCAQISVFQFFDFQNFVLCCSIRSCCVFPARNASKQTLFKTSDNGAKKDGLQAREVKQFGLLNVTTDSYGASSCRSDNYDKNLCGSATSCAPDVSQSQLV